MPEELKQDASVPGRRIGKPVTVLVTGFGRYPGVRRNPTAELMRRVVVRLNREGRMQFAHGGELTVSYAKAPQELEALVRTHAPAAILLLGLAARARWVRIERYARKLDSPLHPDSEGQGGQAHAAASDLPLGATGLIEPALQAMRSQGIRARLSPSAGRYLCNAVYAAALGKAADRPVLFVHVPYPRGHLGPKPARRSLSWQPSLLQLERALSNIASSLACQARRATMAQSAMA